MLDELGLLPALRSYFKELADRTDLRVRFDCSLDAEGLDDERKLTLFRIAQESLTNVVRHARANRVDVTLRRFDGSHPRDRQGKRVLQPRHLEAPGRELSRNAAPGDPCRGAPGAADFA
jgi:two-component sensor histidine kinase